MLLSPITWSSPCSLTTPQAAPTIRVFPTQGYTLYSPRHSHLLQVSFLWLRRVRELTPAITQMLGVRSVWCDTKTEQNSQKFVLWAGYLLEQR